MTDKILIDRSVVEQALKALEKADRISGYRNNWAEVNSLIAALAQPQVEQEPVAWRWNDEWGYSTIQSVKPCHEATPLYTHPQPKREPLTEDEIAELMMRVWGCASIAPRQAPSFARAIERAHGIGGGA